MKRTIISVLVTAWLVSCGGGGGGDVAARAGKAADALCACKDFECTKPHMAELNKLSIKEDDAVEKLSADRRKVYDEAQDRASGCQDSMRPK